MSEQRFRSVFISRHISLCSSVRFPCNDGSVYVPTHILAGRRVSPLTSDYLRHVPTAHSNEEAITQRPNCTAEPHCSIVTAYRDNGLLSSANTYMIFYLYY